MSNPIIQKIKESSTKFKPKKISLREYLNKEYPYIDVDVEKTKSGVVKKKAELSAQELITVIGWFGKKIEKNIRTSEPTIMIKNKRVPLTDGLESKLYVEVQHTLKNEGFYYKKDNWHTAIKALESDNEFCPVIESFELNQWDGVKRLNKDFLGKYFSDKNNMFIEYFTAFLVSAVARAYNCKFQSPVLILTSGQGKGKSYFCEWIGNALGEFYTSKSFDPSNESDLLLCASNLVVEISEANGVLKKDQEKLKEHFTKDVFEFRKKYEKRNTKHKHLANYIATMNKVSNDILKDPTGSRRYIICEIENINKAYSKDIDPIQLWMEAKNIYDKRKEELGTSYEVLIDIDKRNELNNIYYSEPIECSFFSEMLEYTGSNNDKIKITDIITKYKEKSKDNTNNTKISSILYNWLGKEYNVQKEVLRVNGSNPTFAIKGFLLKD